MTICLFTGGAAAFNVQRMVENWGQLLVELDEIHLVTTEPTAFDHVDSIEPFGDEGTGNLRGVQVFQSYLRDHEPSVVVQLTEPPIHGSIVGSLAKIHDVSAVYRYAGDRFQQFRLYSGPEKIVQYGLNNILGRVPLRFADRCIALGPHGRGRLVAYGACPERVHVLPPSIDPSRFEDEEQADLDVPDDRHVVMFLGRISRLKGVGVMERTIDQVLDRRPDLQFVFVGEEERRPNVASEHKDNISIAGRVDPENVPAYLRRADVLAHPSLTEGLPRAVLESLFAGTPVIARDVGDTASVTGNTFRTDREFVEMLCAFEDLPLDDPTPFSIDALRDEYQTFFRYYTHSSSETNGKQIFPT